MTFTEAMEWTSRVFEVVAIVVLVAGFLAGIVSALRSHLSVRQEESYTVLRRYFGRSILLGLEILVAADLIRTVAVDQTWENVLSLGLIVLIRTFLSFSLEVEIDGMWPWRRWSLGKMSGKPASPAAQEDAGSV
jgi:uncharacterized membrane protein